MLTLVRLGLGARKPAFGRFSRLSSHPTPQGAADWFNACSASHARGERGRNVEAVGQTDVTDLLG